MVRRVGRIVRLAWILGMLAGFAAAQECPQPESGFHVPGVQGTVLAAAVFDDGSGSALYVGGSLDSAGPTASSGIAKWDGSAWSSVGPGIQGTVLSLAVFDDGTGPALFAGGSFSQPASRIAKWNGVSWSALGLGTDGDVSAMIAFDDGSGPALYVGGTFTSAGGQGANHVARWDGSTWAALDTGVGAPSEYVLALAAFDDGTGPALYAGGLFSVAGGIGANHVARWDGTKWSAVSGGTDDRVWALAAYDSVAGPALYAGGEFTTADGVTARCLAKWDGTEWSDVGGGVDDLGFGSRVQAFTTFDDGSGPILVAAGPFILVGGVQASGVAAWDGTVWSSFASGTAQHVVDAVCTYDDGSGPGLYAGGSFHEMGGVHSENVAAWTPADGWESVGSGDGLGGDATSVRAMTVYDLGSGDRLFAAGEFTFAGEVAAQGLAAYDGTQWTAVAGNLPQPLDVLLGYDDGSGRVLVAGGDFESIGGTSALNIARWNGAAWQPLGSGLGIQDDHVLALAAFDDGSGTALYAGGDFFPVGGKSRSVFRWNGRSWSPLSIGISGVVRALCVWNDASGPHLYAGWDVHWESGGDSFSYAGVSRWNGSSWDTVGSTPIESFSRTVRGLCVIHDGGGSALCAIGTFPTFADVAANNVAKWNGSMWSALGHGVTGELSALREFDDGTGAGTALYVGEGLRLWKWDGVAWNMARSVATGPTAPGAVDALTTFDEGNGDGPALFLGGAFTNVDGTPSNAIAAIRGCGSPGIPTCFGDGSGAACPCANSGAPGRGCENSRSTGGAALSASGGASLSQDTLTLTVTDEMPSALTVFFQGNSQLSGLGFGDGLRCTGGPLKRLYVKAASLGTAVAPTPGDLSVSARSAALGNVITTGAFRTYQTYYRDPNPTFCPSPLGSTFNASSGLRIAWLP